MIRRHSAPAVVAIAVAALAVAACSSGSSGSSSSSASAGGGTSSSAAPAASSSAGSTYNVAGIYENTQDPFWATFVCGAKAEASQLGVNLKVYSQSTQNETSLSTVLNTALLTNPQGVLFNPIDTTSWNATEPVKLNETSGCLRGLW